MKHEAFYSTAAQVIPVLLLALFVEERLSPRKRTGQSAADDLAYLALLLFGEMTAVSALAGDKDPGSIHE